MRGYLMNLPRRQFGNWAHHNEREVRPRVPHATGHSDSVSKAQPIKEAYAFSVSTTCCLSLKPCVSPSAPILLSAHIVGAVRGNIGDQLLDGNQVLPGDEAESSVLNARRIDVALENDIKIEQFLKRHPSAAMTDCQNFPNLECRVSFAIICIG